jgi:2-dehydropantoate 2-reductase
VLEDGTQEHARNVRAVERMAEAGPQDVVLLTLKAHQLREVVAELPALYGPDTVVVSMVNGVPWWYFHALGGPHEGRAVTRVDPDGAIARAIPPERVIGSVVYPAAELVAPGLVKLVEGNRFTVGEPSNERTPRVEALSQALMKAGFKAPVSRDIRSELWIKLWGNLSFNPISALTHATLEGICRFAPTRELARRMMAEGQSVAEALGVRFKITLEQRLAGAEAVGAHKTSMLQDVEAGRALELEALVGAVIELGQIAGVATPTIEAVYAATKLLEGSVLEARGRLAIQAG